MSSKNIVGAAKRYIVGRNALQTVYWRSAEAREKACAQPRLLKVSKTVSFGKGVKNPPWHVKEEKKLPV